MADLVAAVGSGTDIRFKITGIDGKTLGATVIGTPPAGGRNFIVTRVNLIVASANTLTVTGAFSVGTNSANFDNILPIATATGLTAVGLVFSAMILAATARVPAGTAINFKLTTAFTATAVTIDVEVEGHYE